jgi:hypothetical protein
MNKKSADKKVHYVNNKEFLAEMIKFKEVIAVAHEKGDDSRQRVPNYIGECFVKIAEHLSYKPNFINYTFRDEMIADGVENCLQYVNNFDPEKSHNPFAYFTQIIYYAFLRRIQKEKKQLYIRYKSVERAGLENELASFQEGDDKAGHDVKLNFLDGASTNISDFIDAFEAQNIKKKAEIKKKKKKTKKKKKGIIDALANT